ncbi:MAG: two-component system response regulator AdeR [Natronomonas sp.]
MLLLSVTHEEGTRYVSTVRHLAHCGQQVSKKLPALASAGGDMMPADTEQTRVLIVEDEQNLADLYRIWLVGEYDVRTAYSGKAALESMADREADVVLLDRRMPGLSGDEIAGRLDESDCDTSVVMVTAVVPSPEMATLPINDYIIKPIKKEQLQSTVETAALVRTYDDDISELLSLISRQQALEEEVPTDELEASEEFDRLVNKIGELTDSVDDTIEGLWSQSDPFARIEGKLIDN